MNLLDKLNALEHGPVCHSPGCTCGLSEVRVAVRELVDASEALLSPPCLGEDAEWMRRIRRRNFVLGLFLDAEGDRHG